MAHQLERLQAKHHYMVDLALQGLSRKAIAQKVGATPESIGMIINSPIFQAEFARRRAEMEKTHDQAVSVHVLNAQHTLESASNTAAQALVENLGEEDPAVRQRAADSILDRVFGSRKDSERPATIVIQGDALVNLRVAMEEARSI